MERKRLVDFLLLHIVSLQKTMGGDDIARTNVKAKLMADQGMADAVVPLSDDCLGFQICVDCRIYQKAKEAQRMAFLFLIIDMLVVERYILVCYIIFYRHFAMQRAGYDSLFLGFGVRNIECISRFQPIIHHR